MVNLVLTWSANCVIVSTDVANQNAIFEITNTKLYVPVITLSTQDNAKLFQQLKSGFKRTINCNKYLSKPELLAQNTQLNYLVEPNFKEVNSLFVSAFENDTQRTSAKDYYLLNVELKDYNVMINGEKFFDQPIKNNKVTYYTTGCLLDYPYFKDSYKMIAVDLNNKLR